LDQVAVLIPDRLKAKRSKTHKHDSTPLAFACELAARELNIRKTDDSLYGVEYLLRRYREGRTLQGKDRRKPRPTKKTTP